LTIKRTRLATLIPVVALLASACSSAATATPTPAPTATPGTPAPSAATTGTPAPSASTAAAAASFNPDPTLLAAAKAEGALTLIADPTTWCDYGDMFKGYTAATGINVTVLNPNGGSGDEINAIKNNESGGPNAPDVVDVGLAFGPQGVAAGLFQPYEVSTWSTIPATAKDPNGYWTGDYYGVLSFEVNTTVQSTVPMKWADLLNPIYKGEVALAGDPTVSNQAISAVWAAGIANGGSLDNAAPGLAFFKQLVAAGNFVPVIGTQATVASGETPIRIAWSYNALGDKDALAGNPPITVQVPTDGRFGGMYVQAISKYAPHPNAAKLWMEYIYSDVGQLTWMNGYCTPIRYDDLNSRGVIPASISSKMPDTSGTVLPTLDQVNTATTLITTGWKSQVGVTVK